MGYYANITECSKKLIRRFDTTNPFRIAEGLGIHVIFCDELKQLKGSTASSREIALFSSTARTRNE